jgi:Xaa-Pro aminopeptidase
MEPYASRRRTLLDRLAREHAVAVFRSAPELLRNADTEHDYRQDSGLYYLTGLDEPDSVLVLSGVHPEHRSILFVRPRNPDREIWEGARVGVDEAPKRFGVDIAWSIEELRAKLPEFLQNARRLMTRVGFEASHDQSLFRALEDVRGGARRQAHTWPTEIVDPTVAVDEMRMVKEPGEIELIRHASRITCDAHLQTMKACKPGMREYELEAILSHTYRSRGAERHSFLPIVGSGPNATTLHYVRNDREIQDGDLVLVDSGAEYQYYAADVTRTFPANGKFTPAQRRIYEIVLAAQMASIAATRPGVTIDELHNKTCEVLVDGLLDCGLLTGDRAEILKTGGHKRFYPHRTSHWMGMDVHDVGRYYLEPGEQRTLAAGMVFTIEPGLYIPVTGDLPRDEFRGIGVRIEDDILVTADGFEVLTPGVPKTVEEVEAACRS